MNYRSKLTFIVLFICLQFNSINAESIEGITHDSSSFYFLSSSIISKINQKTHVKEKEVDLSNDITFINQTLTYCINNKLKIIEKSSIQKKIKSGRFLNLSIYSGQVYVSIMVPSLEDPNEKNWAILLLKLDKDLNVINLFVLKNASNLKFGTVSCYPRFSNFLLSKDEIILPSIISPAPKKDSIAYYAVFKLDPKKSEMRFKKNIYSINQRPFIISNIFLKHPENRIVYPINILIKLNANVPTFIQYPFVVIRNYNTQKAFDPFNQIKYANDSLTKLISFDTKIDNGELLNGINGRQIILCYEYKNDTLNILIKNAQNNKLSLLEITNSKIKTQNFKTSNFDLEDSYFYIINKQIFRISRLEKTYSIFRL